MTVERHDLDSNVVEMFHRPDPDFGNVDQISARQAARAGRLPPSRVKRPDSITTQDSGRTLSFSGFDARAKQVSILAKMHDPFADTKYANGSRRRTRDPRYGAR